MSTPKTFSKFTYASTPDEDVIQIKDSEGNVIAWIDATGTPQGNIAPPPPGKTVDLQTNGVENSSQNLLNLQAGANVNLIEGGGTVVIAAQNSVVTNGPTSLSLIPSGLVAEYHFNTGSGTSLVDVSGNNLNGTFGASSAAPTWGAAPQLGVVFNGANSQIITLPDAVKAAKTIMLFLSVSTPATDPAAMVALATTTPTDLITLVKSVPNASLGTAAAYRITTAGGAFGYSPSMMGNQIIAVTLNNSPTSDATFLNGIPSWLYNATGGSGQNVPFAGTLQLGGRTGTTYFTGTMHFACFYNRVLTNAEIAENSKIITDFLSQRQVFVGPSTNISHPDTILMVGESQIAGSVSGNNASAYWSLVGTYNTYNLGAMGSSSGTGGQIVSQLAVFDQMFAPIYQAGASKNVAIVWDGADDFLNGKTVAQVFNLNVELHTKLKKLGFKTIACTYSDAITFTTSKNQFNALIRKYWPTFADSIADIGAIPQLGADGAASNATYFSDGLHITNAGQQLVAGVFQNAINSLYGNTVTSDAVVTATGTYAQLDTDVFLKVNPAGGSAIVNLLSAQKWCGRSCMVYNIQTAGANTVTLAANGSETIMGASTYVVPNNTIVKLQAVLAAPSTGGANWIITP